MRRGFRSRQLFLVCASLVLVLLGLVGGAGATTAAIVQTCDQPPNCPITINDNLSAPATQDQAASPYPSEISFGHADPCCGIIDKVTVTLFGLTHASLADVDILLVREQFGSQPTQVIELMSDVGVGTPATNLNLIFDDSAGPLPAGAPITSGRYRPTNYSGAGAPCAADSPAASSNADPFPAPAPTPPAGGYGQSLGVFSGEQLAGGMWHLYVGDDCAGSSGSISRWRLTFALRSGTELVLDKDADAATVSAGSPIGFTLHAQAFGGETPPFGIALYDPLPPGAGIDWSISPPYSGPGSCSITGTVGDETLFCDFGDLGPGGATVHVTSQTSILSCGSYPNSGTLTSANYPPSGASASTTVLCATGVTVTSFDAIPGRGRVLLRWRHASATKTLGFNVYREQNGRRAKQNRALIPARPRSGRVYSWLDHLAPPQVRLRYWLEEVFVHGGRTWHGPSTAVNRG